MKNKRRHHTSRTPKKLPAAEGVLSCASRGGFGFVSIGDGSPDIYVDAAYMGGANHGDRVTVRPFAGKKHGKSREGIITKVIAREITTLTAVITADFGMALTAKADDTRFYPSICIPSGVSLGAKPGDRVAVELTYFDPQGRPDGAVLKLLGNSDSLKGRIDSIVFNHSIKQEFDAETLAAAEKIAVKIPPKELEKRLDLRGEKIFTIDGEDAKDFDDAVSIRKLRGGSYKLGVHIADVSHYVKERSALDAEAFARGTSVYLPDRVIPMLPEHLSNGVCSLVPDEDRLTLSCIMTVNSDGVVTNYTIAKSVIRSVHRMTYNKVQKILDGDAALCREYRDILTPLTNMNALADILISKRKKRGSIDFDLSEAFIGLGRDYSIEGVCARERLKSHKIIEEFMLLANETVAEHAAKRALPFVYRTHAAPDSDKLFNFNSFLLGFGLSLPENLERGVAPAVFSTLLDKIKGEQYEAIVSKNMLRAMMKAEYRTSNDGHFGLAAQYYCHFTSPIRRYPDLMIHRVLSAELDGRPTARFAGICENASKQSSETERAAEECERDVDTLLKVWYIADYVGAEFEATISSLTEYGIYAELNNTIEGMIRLESIGGDYYIYDEKRNVTKGRRSGRTFKIGERIDIVVAGADANLLRVDFVLKDDYMNRRVKKWNSLK